MQPQQPQQQPFIMNIQQNAGPQGYAPPPPAPAYAPAPAPIVIQQNKQVHDLLFYAIFTVVFSGKKLWSDLLRPCRCRHHRHCYCKCHCKHGTWISSQRHLRTRRPDVSSHRKHHSHVSKINPDLQLSSFSVSLRSMPKNTNTIKTVLLPLRSLTSRSLSSSNTSTSLMAFSAATIG